MSAIGFLCLLHFIHMYTHIHTHTRVHARTHTHTHTHRYIENLLNYLSGYLSRIQPLADQDGMVAEVKQQFEEKWMLGTFPGWRVSGERDMSQCHKLSMCVCCVVCLWFMWSCVYFSRKTQAVPWPSTLVLS